MRTSSAKPPLATTQDAVQVTNTVLQYEISLISPNLANGSSSQCHTYTNANALAASRRSRAPGRARMPVH